MQGLPFAQQSMVHNIYRFCPPPLPLTRMPYLRTVRVCGSSSRLSVGTVPSGRGFAAGEA